MRPSRSVCWRMMFKPRRYSVPIISPYTDRLMRAALGNETCRIVMVRVHG